MAANRHCPDMIESNSTAEDLQLYMARHQITGTEMAARMGVTRAAVSLWKIGGKAGSISAARRKQLHEMTDGEIPLRCPGCERIVPEGTDIEREVKPRSWRVKAVQAVSRQVAQGLLPRAADVPCSAGPDGCSQRHSWHHDSYRREDWLKVRCLCFRHHMQWHRENTATPYEENAP